MKTLKVIGAFLATVLLSTSITAMAAPALSSLQASKHSASDKMARSAAHYQTDVHVLNNSQQIITVKVPGTAINDRLYPNDVEDIFADAYFDAVEIVLYDDAGYEFFRDYVPNHATVEVRNTLAARSDKSVPATKVQAIIKK